VSRDSLATSGCVRSEIAAYSDFAGAITELRARNHQPLVRLGAAADHARFRLQLLAEDPDLMALADAAFEPIGAIHGAADRAELVEHENRCQDLLKAFISAAGTQVR
jgi:hypothetical protein